MAFHPSLAAGPGSELAYRHFVSSVESVLPSLSLCAAPGREQLLLVGGMEQQHLLLLITREMRLFCELLDTTALWKSVSQAGAE